MALTVQCSVRSGRGSKKKYKKVNRWFTLVGEGGGGSANRGAVPFFWYFFFLMHFYYIIFMFFLFFCIITFLVHQIRKSSGSRLNGKPEVGPHGLVCTIKVGPVETICALYEGQYNRPCFLGRPIYILLAF